jgi:hypothetical protein
MKKEILQKRESFMRKDLTKVNGCYSKELREATNDIKVLLKERSITVEVMRDFVNKIIEPAFIEAEAKKRFKENLNECNTKEEIDNLCYMAVLHGMYYMPRKRAQ